MGVLFLIVVQFSWELSRSEERTRRLAEETAMLQARIEALEARCETTGNPADDFPVLGEPRAERVRTAQPGVVATAEGCSGGSMTGSSDSVGGLGSATGQRLRRSHSIVPVASSTMQISTPAR